MSGFHCVYPEGNTMKEGMIVSTQTVNGTFTLQVPDTFEPVSPEELRQMSGGGDPFGWGMRDRERHVMILALWKQYPALLARLADLKAMAKKNQQLTARMYAGHGYRFLETLSGQAGNEKAEGYRYMYSAGDISQVGTCFLIKAGKTVYSIICAGREENKDRDLAMIRDVLKSFQYLS